MRVIGSALIGCTVATCLFLLMMYLVTNRDPGLNKTDDLSAVNFIRFDREEESRTRTKSREKPPEEPPPEEPPPPAADVAATTPPPDAPQPKLDAPDIDTSVDFDSGPYLGDREAVTTESSGSGGGVSSEVVPVVQVPPKYPSTAKRANIEGYVTMEFTVNADGSVTDIRVVDAQPPRMFNRSAKQALERWKFRPRQQGGQRVARNARQTIRFTLE